MHLMPKCCVFCFAKNKDAALTFCLQNVRKRQNAFDAKMHFGVHFPKENVQRTSCSAYIFQRKMFSVHFPKENVQLCKNAFDAKMHFCVHFTKENVQHHILLCKMFSITFYFVKCSASHFVLLNIFLCKMFSIKNKKHFIS